MPDDICRCGEYETCRVCFAQHRASPPYAPKPDPDAKHPRQPCPCGALIFFLPGGVVAFDDKTSAPHTCTKSDLPGLAARESARPAHYGGADSAYECIKVIEAWDLNFNLGNVVKYVNRAGRKPGASDIEDLTKARQYLDFEIARRQRAAGRE